MGEIEEWRKGGGSGDHMLAIYYLLLTVAPSISLFISLKMASHTYRRVVQRPKDTQGKPDSRLHFMHPGSICLNKCLNLSLHTTTLNPRAAAWQPLLSSNIYIYIILKLYSQPYYEPHKQILMQAAKINKAHQFQKRLRSCHV